MKIITIDAQRTEVEFHLKAYLTRGEVLKLSEGEDKGFEARLIKAGTEHIIKDGERVDDKEKIYAEFCELPNYDAVEIVNELTKKIRGGASPKAE